MKIKDYTKEELENMSYDDLAVLVLEDAGKKLKIMDIFQKINNLLGLSESENEDKIADFFELLSTNKNFIMLDKGYWDLRSKHAPKIVVDEEEDISEEIIEEEEDIEEEEEKDIFYETDSDDDEEEDDLKDLVVVEGEEEEQI